MSQHDDRRPKPLVLAILDGFGIAPQSEGNAITQAKTPGFSLWTQRYPVVTLKASGEEVGLSWGEMGNSEVGHLALGSGRVYMQTLPRIQAALSDGSFFRNEAFLGACDHVKKSGGTLHIVGILSSGKVHGYDEHVFSLVKLAKSQGIDRIAVHAILDGRDTLYNSGRDFLAHAEDRLREIGVGCIASISGRFYAMDRDNRWDRVEKAYRCIALGEGPSAEHIEEAITQSYGKEVYDEEFVPTVITRAGKPRATFHDGDGVIFANFRPDRAREFTKACVLPAFEGFSRAYIPHLFFVTMVEYEQGLPVHVAFPPVVIQQSFSEVISRAGLRQLHIAETEKYAHVTFFFNGTKEDPFSGEDRILIPSPRVALYSEKPEMSAYLITERLCEEIRKDIYDVIIVNFANPDMVAHTGDLSATVKSIEVTDECLQTIAKEVLAKDGVLCITGDHGNAEEVLNLQTHGQDKEHSTNPVPLWIIGRAWEGKAGISGDVPNGDISLLPPVGILADVAPTLLAILGIPQPEDMTGTSLLP